MENGYAAHPFSHLNRGRRVRRQQPIVSRHPTGFLRLSERSPGYRRLDSAAGRHDAILLRKNGRKISVQPIFTSIRAGTSRIFDRRGHIGHHRKYGGRSRHACRLLLSLGLDRSRSPRPTMVRQRDSGRFVARRMAYPVLGALPVRIV